MKQATTYTNLIAICPHCNYHGEIEHIDDGEDLDVVECLNCNVEFTACLPNSDYHDNP